MYELVKKVDIEYLANQDKFLEQQELDDWEPLYDQLTQFEEFDEIYYEQNDETMSLLEKYARRNPEEFVTLID